MAPMAIADSAEEDLDIAAAEFIAMRPRLFGIAYRMLGSAADAEDLVQDTWIRWQNYDRSKVLDAAAFLATTITRLAINLATSAHARHERYIGPWLPEPIATSGDPAFDTEHKAAIEMALLRVLEDLSPTERAAYVLREAFEYPYEDIARIIQKSEPSTRQLVSRARRHLAERRHLRPADLEEHRRLLEAFMEAAQLGDVAGLERLLAADAVSISDGGGNVRASRNPVLGRSKVAKYYHSFVDRFWIGAEVRIAETNGLPSAILVRDGEVSAVVHISFGDDGITEILWAMNPDKLRHLPVPA